MASEKSGRESREASSAQWPGVSIRWSPWTTRNGMSGARPGDHRNLRTARAQARYALTTMCIGVGQGIAVLIERV